MKIGIFETPPQKWFPFDKDTEVLIQYIEKAKLNTILMQGAEAAKKMKAKAGSVQDIFLGKAAVFGWRKITDHDHPGMLLPSGDPLPFTPENRNLAITKSQRFSEFVYRIATDETQFIDDDIPELDADDLKGLEDVLAEFSKEEQPGNE
jgi:hypothetical protein